jgi:hypothetical protein
MFLANCKLWPLVNVISFTLVPLEHRMLFSQMINLVWGVYLSCKFFPADDDDDGKGLLKADDFVSGQ